MTVKTEYEKVLQAFMITGIDTKNHAYILNKYSFGGFQDYKFFYALELDKKYTVPIYLNMNLSTKEVIQEIIRQVQLHLDGVYDIVDIIRNK